MKELETSIFVYYLFYSIWNYIHIELSRCRGAIIITYCPCVKLNDVILSTIQVHVCIFKQIKYFMTLFKTMYSHSIIRLAIK